MTNYRFININFYFLTFIIFIFATLQNLAIAMESNDGYCAKSQGYGSDEAQSGEDEVIEWILESLESSDDEQAIKILSQLSPEMARVTSPIEACQLIFYACKYFHASAEHAISTIDNLIKVHASDLLKYELSDRRNILSFFASTNSELLFSQLIKMFDENIIKNLIKRSYMLINADTSNINIKIMISHYLE